MHNDLIGDRIPESVAFNSRWVSHMVVSFSYRHKLPPVLFLDQMAVCNRAKDAEMVEVDLLISLSVDNEMRNLPVMLMWYSVLDVQNRSPNFPPEPDGKPGANAHSANSVGHCEMDTFGKSILRRCIVHSNVLLYPTGT